MYLLNMAAEERTSSKHWTIAQALAWVIYRSEDLVKYVSPGGGKLSLIAMYPSRFSPMPIEKASGDELLSALEKGLLEAKGKRSGASDLLEPIPAEDWLRLRRHGAVIYQLPDDKSEFTEPWRDITFESSDIKKQWRSDHEVKGRTSFDWPAIKKIYDQVKETNPDFSINALITEAQGAYEDRYNKDPPSRSSFQSHIKEWR